MCVRADVRVCVGVHIMQVECNATLVSSSMDQTDPALLVGLPKVNFSTRYSPVEGVGGMYHSISAIKVS